jgi:hypothetical protein
MKSKVAIALQIFLWFICAFHVTVGIGLNVSPEFPQLLAQYYGAQVNWTPELLYIVKPIGAFMLVLGVLAGLAARDPLAHSSVVYGFVLLFTVRGLQRLISQDEIESALRISSERNFGNAIYFLLMAAALLLLFRFASKQASADS